MNARIPSEGEVLDYFTTLSNWGRWGPDDRLGTLNLVTPQKRVQAAGLVREGILIGCARPVSTEMTADAENPPPVHFMVKSGEAYVTPSGARLGPRQVARDFIGMIFHGITVTHVDARHTSSGTGRCMAGAPPRRSPPRPGLQSTPSKH